MFGAPLIITNDLRISIGDRFASLTPTQGLKLAEQLARKSFRRALAEEAGLTAGEPSPASRSRKSTVGRA